MPLMLAVASFRVSRLQGFFAISVVMLMGSQLRVGKERARGISPQRRRPRPGRGWQWFSSSALAIISGSLKAASENIGCVRMDSDKLPEASIS